MIVPNSIDARHKIQLFRLLRSITEHKFLSHNLVFKGGTCAALRGILDRFSVDLDFDLPYKTMREDVRVACYNIFSKLKLEIKDESQNYLQFILKYSAPPNIRNTLKLEINDDVNKANTYEEVYLPEMGLYIRTHDLGTMFANKLVATKARYDNKQKFAGRDFYDIYKFYMQGLPVT